VKELQPGAALQDGKLVGVYTNEQHWKLIEAFRIADPQSHEKLMLALVAIAGNYKGSALEDYFGPMGQHKERLAAIANASRRLHLLIKDEPAIAFILWETLSTEERKHEGAQKEVDARLELLLRCLPIMMSDPRLQGRGA
jgi:hypothetical protein